MPSDLLLLSSLPGGGGDPDGSVGVPGLAAPERLRDAHVAAGEDR